jgi:pantetheine-phosphate adenylyltransferase
VPRYRHAVLGGTFDHFHVGHVALLESALRTGRSVSVGVTTDRFIAAHPKPYRDRIQPFTRRRRAILTWARRRHPGRRVRVVPLENPFGRSVEGGVDALVVSAETLAGGKAVNAERRRLGRAPLPLVVVPVVLADDLEPVSSRRIRAKEIDRLGRRLSRLKVGLAVSDPADRPAVRAAIRHAFPTSSVHVLPVSPTSRGVSNIRRVRPLARQAARGRELGIAVVRGERGNWAVLLQGRALTIGPLRLPRGGPEELVRGVARILRPQLGRKVLGPSRP